MLGRATPAKLLLVLLVLRPDHVIVRYAAYIVGTHLSPYCIWAIRRSLLYYGE
jgi:hypothetical protein